MKTVFHKRGNYAWRDACQLCLDEPEARVVLRAEALELLHPGRARRERRSARSKPRTTAAAARSSRCSSIVLKHPALYTGPRMMKPPVVHTAGLLRRIDAGRHDGRLGVDRRALRPAALLPAERRGLGRHALARHRHVPRPLDRRDRDPRTTSASTPSKAKEALDAADRAQARARASGTTPRSRPRRTASSSASRNRVAERRGLGSSGSSEQYPVLLENALRQLIAVSPDLQTA